MPNIDVNARQWPPSFFSPPDVPFGYPWKNRKSRLMITSQPGICHGGQRSLSGLAGIVRCAHSLARGHASATAGG